MRVLHFSNKPAFPLRDGGCIAIKSILQSLLSDPEIKISHFTISTPKHPFSEESYPEKWRKNMQLDHFHIDTKTNWLDAGIQLLKNKSYNVTRFYSKKLEIELEKRVKKETFDLIIMESIYLLPYLRVFKNNGIKVVLRAHNVEHEVWGQLAENQTNFIYKKYYTTLARQLKEFEVKKIKEVDALLAITTRDLEKLSIYLRQQPRMTLPTGVNTNYLTPHYSMKDFYFLGAMDWQPNKQGVDWLIKKVLYNNDLPEKVNLAGKSLDPKINFGDAIVNHGEVKNAKQFIDNHGICLIPLKSGSGLKIKLLENMAMAKPIISTSEGAKGVHVKHNKHLIIADDPDKFYQAMRLLSEDMEKRKELGKAAQSFVIDNFDEEKIAKKLIEFISHI